MNEWMNEWWDEVTKGKRSEMTSWQNHEPDAFDYNAHLQADTSKIRLVAETEKNGVDKWVADGAIPPHPSVEGFTVIETYDYQASLK